MRPFITSIGALLVSAAMLLVGGGLLATLVAVSAEKQGFSVITVGFLSSSYFTGFMTGCLLTSHLVKRVGHVRVFAALSSLIATSALIHILLVNMPIWFILRAISGFCFAGLYILIESWINEKSPNDRRGQILSIYRFVDLGAFTLGQFLLTLADPVEFQLFSIVAILITLSIFPISLSTSKTPEPVTSTKLNIKKLIHLSPLSVAGCFVVGLTTGAFWGVAPVFVSQLGYSIVNISIFMSSSVSAAALMQWPIGWLSDKVGRRPILISVAFGGAFSGVFLWIFAPQSLEFMIIGGILYGSLAMQIFGMAAAHANDYADKDEFVAINGGLLLIYGIGSIMGPTLASIIMSLFGPSSMFAYTALIQGLLAVYGTYRVFQRNAPDSNDDYVPMARPRQTLLVLRSDPRNNNPSFRRNKQ